MKLNCYLVNLFLLCFVLPGILAIFQYERERPLPRFPSRQRFQPRRFESLASRLKPRPLFQRSRVRTTQRLFQHGRISNPTPHGLRRLRQDTYPAEPRLFNQQPRLREVSVPSVRRTPIPKRETFSRISDGLRGNLPAIGINERPQSFGPVFPRVRQRLALQRQTNTENNDQNNLDRSLSISRNTLSNPRVEQGIIQPLVRQPSAIQRRTKNNPIRLKYVSPIRKTASQVLPKVVSRKQAPSTIQNPVLVRQLPKRVPLLRIPSKPLVAVRTLPRVLNSKSNGRQAVSVQTKPLHGPQIDIATSDTDSISIALQTQLTSKSIPSTILNKHQAPVEQQGPHVPPMQTISETTGHLSPMTVLRTNKGTTNFQSQPLVRQIQTNPDYSTITSHQNQIIQSGPGVAPENQNPVYAVDQPNLGIGLPIAQPDVQVATVAEPLNTISSGSVPLQTIDSTGTAPQVNTLHADLVEAFTSVIESLLVPKISGSQTAAVEHVPTNNNIQNIHNTIGPLSQPVSNAQIPQQVAQPYQNTHNAPGHMSQPVSVAHLPQQVGQSYPQASIVNQFAPSQVQGPHMMANPYAQFGYMQSFGYMNPWMSSAAMQEMMYGDTTDPPDIITTTAAPNNVSAVNSTDSTTIAANAIDSNISLSISNQEKIGIEAPGAHDASISSVVVTDKAAKSKDLNVKIEASVDAIQNKDVLPSDGHSKMIEMKPKANQNLDTADVKIQKAKPDSSLVNIDTSIEIQPVVISDIKPSTEAKIDVLATTTLKNKMQPSDIGTKIESKFENKAKKMEKATIDPIIKSTMSANKPQVKPKAKLKKTKPKALRKVRKLVTGKKVDKNEKLILDIASLIRNSKLDLGKLSNIVSGRKKNSQKVDIKPKPNIIEKTNINSIQESIKTVDVKLMPESIKTVDIKPIPMGREKIDTKPIQDGFHEVDMRPIPERYPTAKQLGIKLTPPKRSKRPRNKVRPTKYPTEYTKTPKITPTLPPVPKVDVENNITIPTLIPKGLVFTRQPEIYRTLRTILKHKPDAVKKAISTDPTPINGFTKVTEGPVITNLVDNSQDGPSPALVSILTKLTKTSTAKAIEPTSEAPVLTKVAGTSTVKVIEPTSEVPVLANVVDHKVEQKLIGDEAAVNKKEENLNFFEMTTISNAGNTLQKQLSDLKLTKDDSGMARYLNDPAFVNLLKGILKNMASKPEVTTPEYYYHEPETTTFYPEFTTTSESPTTTEEYEAEDYITEAP